MDELGVIAVFVLRTTCVLSPAALGAQDDDAPLCNGLVATIVGTDGDDVLQGTFQNDLIVGLGGNDTINGASGEDTITGAEGEGQNAGDAVGYSEPAAGREA